MARLKHGDHVCHVYRTAAERLAVIVPFLQDGLARNEQTIYIDAADVLPAVRAALADAGEAVAVAEARGALQLLTPAQTYLRDGAFAPAAMVATARQLISAATASGYTGLRISANTNWALDSGTDLRLLTAYEAEVNLLLAASPALGMCQYDRTRFPVMALQDVLRTHPLALLDDQLCPNLFYEPLGLAAGEDGAAQRVDWMLRQLRSARAAVQEHEATLRQLQQERQRLEAMVRQIPGGVLIVEAESGRIVLCNEEMGRLCGVTITAGAAVVDYRGYPTAYPDGHPYPAEEWPLFRSLRDGLVIRDEPMALQLPDGSTRVISVSSAPLRDAAGRVVAGVVTAHDVTDARKAEQALREREDQLRAALDAARMGTWEWNLRSGKIRIGGHYDQIFGLPAGAPHQMRADFLKCVHPADLPMMRELAARGTPHESFYASEFRIIRPDGTQRWVASRGQTYWDEHGQPLRRAGVVTDITDRKEADQALRDSEERYRQLFETSPNPMLVFDWETKRFLAVNDAAVEHYGWSRAEFLARSIFDIHPDADLPRLQRHFAALPPVGKVGVWQHCKRDGTLIDVEVRGHYIQLGGRLARFVLALDITERLRAEQALRSSEAKYRSLIENLDLQIFLKDQHGRYVAANQRFCQALGKAESAIVGRTDRDLFPPALAAQYQADDQRVTERGERVENEGMLLADGKERTVRIVRTPVKDERGIVSGVLGMLWDVTEQRALENQVRQAQKMEAIGMLAGGVAHDFNNLLTVIVGNIALALGSLPEDHLSRDLMLTAEQAGVQANELTNRLLGFARQTILRPVPTALQTCMEETARILRRTVDPRITLELRTPPGLWVVEADPAQINQVVLNLCLNARDAMPDGGRLVLEAANVVIDSAHARHHLDARKGDFVRLSVSDTGHGISSDVRSRIFEPFFTTKAPGKGTGLGLSMVFGIIKQHQGWVDFASEVGQGTKFDIYLPRHGAAVKVEVAPVPAPARPRGGSETVLLADDEPMIRSLGKTILERYGYHVLLADDGLEAVQLYERERERIGLVILDLTMPRLSGHDALQHLLQIDPQVRVLIASGYSAEHLDQGYHQRAMGFISKPFRPDQLAQLVRAVLDKVR